MGMKKVKMKNMKINISPMKAVIFFYSLMTPECQAQYPGHKRNSEKYSFKKMNVSSSSAATSSWLKLDGTLSS